MKNKKEKYNQHAIYIMIYIVLTLILLIRTRYGFDWTDEAYYVSVTNRFLGGDRFISDDWYISQLVAITLLPLVSIYKCLIGSLEGIYLFFRIVFVLGQTVVAIIFYNVMVKKKSDRGSAFAASLVIMFYCRAYICTLSYYSIAFWAYILLLLFLYDYQEYKRVKAFYIGICVSIVTIINPYFVGVYIVAIFILMLANINRTRFTKKILQEWNQLFVVSGIAIFICILITGITVMKDNSISDIFSCIPIILNEQGYNNSIIWKFIQTFKYVVKQFKYTFILLGVSLFYSFVLIWKKKVTRKKSITIFVLSFIFFIINCLVSSNWSGGIQAAFAFLGLQAFLLNDKRNEKIFLHFYLPGLLMALMMNLSSDTGFSAMTLGLTISGAISCIFVWDFIKWLRMDNKFLYLIGVISIAVVVVIPQFFRIYVVYRDSNLSNLNYEMREGPAKGLYTTYERKEQYEEIMQAIEEYCNREGMVLILSWCPWAYLCTDMKCGAYTTWNLKMEKNEEKLKTYYELYPERIPDVVIILNDEIGKIDMIDHFRDLEYLSTRPQADSKRNTSFLWKYLEESGYRKIPVKCGIVYQNDSNN